MKNIIDKYKQLLHLQDACFTLINHEDAMVAKVYKITTTNGNQFILKISERSNDYFKEIFFLKQLANTLPVPKIIQLMI